MIVSARQFWETVISHNPILPWLSWLSWLFWLSWLPWITLITLITLNYLDYLEIILNYLHYLELPWLFCFGNIYLFSTISESVEVLVQNRGIVRQRITELCKKISEDTDFSPQQRLIYIEKLEYFLNAIIVIIEFIYL